jgi:hypothetical protein
MTPKFYRTPKGDVNSYVKLPDDDVFFLNGRFTVEELKQIVESDGAVDLPSVVNRLETSGDVNFMMGM